MDLQILQRTFQIWVKRSLWVEQMGSNFNFFYNLDLLDVGFDLAQDFSNKFQIFNFRQISCKHQMLHCQDAVQKAH